MLTVDQMVGMHALLTDAVAMQAKTGQARGEPIAVLVVTLYCHEKHPEVGQPYQHDANVSATVRDTHDPVSIYQQLSTTVEQWAAARSGPEGHA